MALLVAMACANCAALADVHLQLDGRALHAPWVAVSKSAEVERQHMLNAKQRQDPRLLKEFAYFEQHWGEREGMAKASVFGPLNNNPAPAPDAAGGTSACCSATSVTAPPACAPTDFGVAT